MKIQIQIHSFQRKEMLLNLLKEINDFRTKNPEIVIAYSIFDDKSDFVLGDANFYQFEEHKGKELFWQIFDHSIKSCKDSDADIFVFVPSDVSNIDFKRLISYHLTYSNIRHDRFSNRAYCYNIMRDNRLSCWNNQQMIPFDNDTYKSWFTDCGFFSNKLLLEQLDFKINPVNPERFVWNKNISSGVGQQMTMILNQKKINIFHPIKSLCFHGSHDSEMHPGPEGRIKNPLKSI